MGQILPTGVGGIVNDLRSNMPATAARNRLKGSITCHFPVIALQNSFGQVRIAIDACVEHC